ncbi:LysR family transcriptional regulator [Silvimonas amylolytica]|uniref:LysR family transcriptional regulator n=1 Tax=Silvimonas amylolytica TaxID=449663 RepID=A0ABQ2PGD6_9NEIS|nr:LysR family transcriptional regulator [Silvimonas amylolytica]GGP24348.1 LysR family transcriptional regulator [Silvimonas amylolytica]
MNLARLDLNLLTSLDVLLAECNVTRAAGRLNLSQPALSNQLKQLRALFDDPLLVPGGPRGMLPTPRALALQEPLRDYLAQLIALVAEQKGFDPAAATRTWRLAASDAVHSVVIPGLLRRLRAKAPGCRLALLQPTPNLLLEMASTNEVDLVLASQPSMPDQLKHRELYKERFVCVMRKDHPLAGAPLDLDSFCAASHLLSSTSGGKFEGIVDDTLAALGRTRHVMLSVPSFLLVPSLLANSDLISTVPLRMARTWQDRVTLLAPPCEIAGFSMEMGWHPRNHADPALRWLREQIMEVVSEELVA